MGPPPFRGCRILPVHPRPPSFLRFARVVDASSRPRDDEKARHEAIGGMRRRSFTRTSPRDAIPTSPVHVVGWPFSRGRWNRTETDARKASDGVPPCLRRRNRRIDAVPDVAFAKRVECRTRGRSLPFERRVGVLLDRSSVGNVASLRQSQAFSRCGCFACASMSTGTPPPPERALDTFSDSSSFETFGFSFPRRGRAISERIERSDLVERIPAEGCVHVLAPLSFLPTRDARFRFY